jgi:hypothetical protein
MKKLLTIVAVAGLSAAAFGQGLINWSGAAGNLIGEQNGTAYSPLVPFTGGTLSGVSNVTPAFATSPYYYELLVGANGLTSDPSTLSAFGSTWLDTSLSAQNSTAANGKIAQTGNSSSVAANTSANGGNYSFLVVGWSANLGTSWSTVLNELNNWQADASTITGTAYFGVSAVGSSVPVASVATGVGVAVIGAANGLVYNPSSAPMQLDQVGLPVPEPGTLALAALGGASMLMLRRKK